MEKDLKNILFRNPQVANTVNCFNEKLKLIEDKYPEEFSVVENIILTFNDYEIKKEIIGTVSENIKFEINQSFSECLAKFDVAEKSPFTES
jgi:Zn-dependent M16 (insulinase) family peptidase